MGLVFHEKYERGVWLQYRKQGNASCALARGYARVFEEEKGHRPSIEELKSWAVERFQADLEKMEIGPERPWWIPPPEPKPRQPQPTANR